MALLRVKLDAVNVAHRHRAAELSSVLRGRGDIGRSAAFYEEGMEKVEARGPLHVREQRLAVGRADVIPAHMGQPDVGAPVRRELAYATLEVSEPGQLAFFARLGEHLHSHTYAEHR